MNEQNEQPHELFEQDVQPVSLDEAAHRLGLSRDAVRMRLSRGRLRGSRAQGSWLVYLTGAQAERTEPNSSNNRTNRTNNERTVRTVFDSTKVEQLAALERERDGLAADKAWLQTQLEGRGVELAEMRRLLGNAQQQIEGMARALPAPEMPPGASQMATTPADTAELPATTAVDRELKGFGLKRKQRRKLLDRLSDLLGLNR